MASTRTDIHAPGAVDFDPEAYTVVGVFDLNDCQGGNSDNRHFGLAVDKLAQRGIAPAAHSNSGGCGHCGQVNLRYVALMYRADRPEAGWIISGQDCLSNRFLDMTRTEFRAIMARAAESRAAQKLLAAFTALCEQYPALAWATYADNIDRGIEADLADLVGTATLDRESGTSAEDHRFAAGLGWGSSTMFDIARRARQYGRVSEPQIRLLGRILDEQADKVVAYRGKLDARREQIATAVEIAPGRRVVEGVVTKVAWVSNDFGGRDVMTVDLGDGTRVWGTVPASIDGVEVGERIRFTATIERASWSDDPSFGKLSRPAKAVVLAPVTV